jgi:ribosomal protein S18 acetylase RimI-like enzyme
MTEFIKTLGGLKQVAQVIRIHNRVWPGSIGIIEALADSDQCFLAVSQKGTVLGYAFVEMDKKKGFVEIQDITVDPDHQGKGIGNELMRRIMDQYDYVKLMARLSSETLMQFYLKHGFVTEMVFENYYGIDEDGARMVWKKIPL